MFRHLSAHMWPHSRNKGLCLVLFRAFFRAVKSLHKTPRVGISLFPLTTLMSARQLSHRTDMLGINRHYNNEWCYKNNMYVLPFTIMKSNLYMENYYTKLALLFFFSHFQFVLSLCLYQQCLQRFLRKSTFCCCYFDDLRNFINLWNACNSSNNRVCDKLKTFKLGAVISTGNKLQLFPFFYSLSSKQER